MRSSRFQLVIVSAALFAGCTPRPASEPAPVVRVSTPVATTGAARRPPNPMAQDTARRKQVDSILVAIKGRENEPAGNVFKNVKVLKAMPAGDFVRNMDTIYGRGLGMTCANCHVVGQYDGDTRKNKRVAREMQTMEDYINTVQLANTKELDEDFHKVSCVTCHAGNGHPRNTMPVPAPSSASLPALSR
ncbi:MAG: photosynthetic reaction center cytochrome c subunit family protein [Gemmatimonadaceae bacterium]